MGENDPELVVQNWDDACARIAELEAELAEANERISRFKQAAERSIGQEADDVWPVGESR